MPSFTAASPARVPHLHTQSTLEVDSAVVVASQGVAELTAVAREAVGAVADTRGGIT